MIARLIFTRQLRQQFESGAQEGWIVLQTPDIEYRLRADELHLTEEQPRLKGNVEIIERHTGGPTRRIKAESVAFKEDRSTGMVQINAAGNVTIHSEDHPDRPVKRNTERLPPIPLPQPVLKEAATWTDARLLDPDGSLVSLGRRVEERRQAVLHKVGEIDREITGELHARTAFALSVLVLVILGAGLAIVLRNAQVLVAFGISFIPSVAVVTLVIAGKQLIEKPPTVQAGIAVIWAGLALVAILDLYILTRVVRR
jgi:lipopolysaccharide export LptBFGC system permease protein LptF